MRWITKETWWRDESERKKGCTIYSIYVCHFSRPSFYFSFEIICAYGTMVQLFRRRRRRCGRGWRYGYHLILLHYHTMHCNSHFTWSMTNTLFYFIFFYFYFFFFIIVFISPPPTFPTSGIIGWNHWHYGVE